MPQDYILDSGFDLLIKDGDFVVGESTAQHQDLLIRLEKGELRQYPKTGVGIKTFFNDDQVGSLYGEIQQQFEGDGMVINKIAITSDGKMEINAAYKE